MATYLHNPNDITPEMTADDAPSPNVVSASTSDATLRAWKAFSHVVEPYTNGWATTGASTGWLKFDLGSGNSGIVETYTVTCGDGSNLNRAPKTWTLQGSNNDADWDVLDTQTNVPVWTALGEMRTYSISSSADYRYYKLDITSSQGGSYLTVGELELIEALPTSYYIEGYVKEGTIPVNRQIYLHNRNTGALITSTTSSGAGGYFYMETTYSGAHYVVCLDDVAGADYNDLIYGNIYPATTSG